MSTSRPRRRTRGALIAAACLAAFTLSIATASAATVTKNSLLTGITGFPSVAGGLGVYEAGGVPGPGDASDAIREVGAYDVTVAADVPAETPYAGAWRAYAVTDIRYHTDNAVAYPMVLQLAATAWAGEFDPDVAHKLEWLLRHADGLIAGEADPGRAAAAIQVVVWQTLRNPPVFEARANLTVPTTDPAVNALAAKFTALMDSGFTTPTGTSIALQAGPVSACGSTLTITSTPGTVVTLTITHNGVLSTKALVIGPDGTATAAASTAPGVTVTVTATVATGGVLVRADGLHEPDAHTTDANRSEGPEELIFLAGTQSAAASIPFTCQAPPPPPGTPTGAPTTPPAAAGTLRIVKNGPVTAVAGQVVTYRIKLTNTSAVAVTGVVLRDILPPGLSVLKVPKGATLKKGVVTWSVGALAPGAAKTVALRVRIDRGASGTRCNRASATGVDVTLVKAAACTAIRAVAGAVRLPPVTG